MHVSPTSRSPCGPSHVRWTRPPRASSVWFVVMFDVAFSRRMCCSRVCRVRTIAALARGVDRLADDPPRHAADVVGAARDEAVVRAAVGLGVPRALALADRERAAVVARRLEHAERDEVDVRDRQRSGVVRGRGDVRGRLEATEEVRLLEDDRRRVDRCGGDAPPGRSSRRRAAPRRPRGRSQARTSSPPAAPAGSSPR